MAELDDQTLTDLGSEEAVQTPLDSILEGNATDASAPEREGELGGLDDGQVPLRKLRKERERRQRADKQVEEMRAELERFDNAKWGIPTEEEQAKEEQERQERWAREEQELNQDPAVVAYNRSYANFSKQHGPDVVAKIDAGLKRLNAEQQQHVLHLTGTQADPVAAIHAYVDQLGLLDFKGAPIDQILTKDKQPQGQQAGDPRLAEYVAQLNEYGQAVSKAEQRANFSASKADFVSEYGKQAYNQIDQLSVELAHSGHPLGQQFVEAVKTSSDPVVTAAQLLHQLGLWRAEAQQAPRQQVNLPSNLANRRNMGQRNGPAYGGPTPLNDIFKH